jgi:peptidoglycan-associated lipoprotein
LLALRNDLEVIIMSRLVGAARGGVLAAVAALGLACGGTKPPDSHTAAAAASTGDGARTDAPRAATASNVNISDEIRSKCGIPDADAYFAFDSSRVTEKDRNPLDLVARCFTSGPLRGHAVELVGRADPRGASDYNFTLGQGRADAVSHYLAAHGLDKGKAQSTSRGAMDATGTDEATWQRDRRVDVLLGN